LSDKLDGDYITIAMNLEMSSDTITLLYREKAKMKIFSAGPEDNDNFQVIQKTVPFGLSLKVKFRIKSKPGKPIQTQN
jgi:hypothetical protein